MEADWLDGAVEKITADLRPGGTQKVDLRRLSGRALAEDITAPFDLPPSDLSLMDGYAVRREDLASASASAPAALRLGGRLKAGDSPKGPLSSGECLKVATGAALPLSSDAVVMAEWAEERDGKVFFSRPPGPWQFVRRRASAFKAGQKVAARGDLLGPGEVAILASLGRKFARVFRKPRISAIATGDELVMPGGQIQGGQIYASNLYLIAAMAEGCGADVVRLDIAGDDADEIARSLSSALWADMIVITGGTSSGPHDVTLKAFDAIGAEIVLSGLKARPCDKLRAGRLGGKPLFSLPGRPEAAQVNFCLFLGPAIKKIAGFSNYKNIIVKAFYDGIKLKGMEFQRFLLAKAWIERGRLLASLQDDDGRSPGGPTVRRRAVLVCPPGSIPIVKGSQVDLIFAD